MSDVPVVDSPSIVPDRLSKEDWGIRTTFEDNVDGVLARTVQETAPILEANVADYNSGDMGKTKLGWGRRRARIPMGVAMEWRTKYGVDVFKKDHAPAVRRLLNSNEYRYL